MNGVDPNGRRVLVSSKDQVEYAKWTHSLSKKDALMVAKAEKSDIGTMQGFNKRGTQAAFFRANTKSRKARAEFCCPGHTRYRPKR